MNVLVSPGNENVTMLYSQNNEDRIEAKLESSELIFNALMNDEINCIDTMTEFNVMC